MDVEKNKLKNFPRVEYRVLEPEMAKTLEEKMIVLSEYISFDYSQPGTIVAIVVTSLGSGFISLKIYGDFMIFLIDPIDDKPAAMQVLSIKMGQSLSFSLKIPEIDTTFFIDKLEGNKYLPS